MDVRIVNEPSMATRPESDYVRVHTFCDPNDDTVTLATIERVFDKPQKPLVTESKPNLVKRIKTLIMRKPMSIDDALGLAKRYAEAKKIEVVYADRG